MRVGRREAAKLGVEAFTMSAKASPIGRRALPIRLRIVLLRVDATAFVVSATLTTSASLSHVAKEFWHVNRPAECDAAHNLA